MVNNVAIIKTWERSFFNQEDSLYKMFDFYMGVVSKKSEFVKTLNNNLRRVGNDSDVFYLSSKFDYNEQKVQIFLNKTEIDKS